MDFLSFIKESSPKINKILETEYQNYLNFQKPLEFLKVGHIYECNFIRYGGVLTQERRELVDIVMEDLKVSSIRKLLVQE